MLNKLREFRALNAFAKRQSVGMQRKLMLYWVSMILVVFAAVILLLSIAGAFSQNDVQLHEVMELHMNNTRDSLTNHLDRLTAQSLKLSRELSRELEAALAQEGVTLGEANDDPERLLRLQQVMYPLVNTTLQTADCNGAYVILDATANTSLEVAEHSRSGIHLRYSNLSASSPVTPTVVYFRGIPDIARQKDLELHNRWNLEFDTDQLPGFRELMDSSVDRPAERYFWSRRIELKDTWESAMLLCVPIVGSVGSIYGVCGVELSALYFQLSYPALDGKFGSAVTVLAPLRDGRLMLSEGLVGSVSGTYLDAILQRIRLGLRAVYRPAPDHADIQRRGRGHRLGRRHPDTAGQLRRIHCGRAKDLGHRGPGAASGALGSLLLSVAEICPAHHRQP